MNRLFRWAHFSDIHFQTDNATFNTKQLRESLPRFIKDNINNCDALIISGDFRFAKEKEENPQKVVDYIKVLMDALGIDNTGNVFTIPGNHDLDRSESRKYIVQGIQKDYDPDKGEFPQDVLTSLRKSFVFYNRLHEMLKDGSQWRDDNPHCVINLPQCDLLLLNTALTSCCDEDHERLILGSLFVDSLISKCNKSKPIIAIGHHSLKELLPNEQKTISKFFDENGIRLYLCGHSHEQWFDSYGELGKQITVGCMMQKDKSVDACFGIGELLEDGRVDYQGYKWDFDHKNWCEYPLYKREYASLFNIRLEKTNSAHTIKTENAFSICGYSLLGALGADGIKYYWKKDNALVESIALNKRLRNPIQDLDLKTSAYTVSTSLGCGLSSFNSQCLFCGTGKNKFNGELTADDIALQCIFMAEYDSNCTSYPEIRDNYREFAFMGQGEPGLNYPSVREAIILTDIVMERLAQKVSRYIISTCGVSNFIPALIHDIRSGVFRNRVTLHFSLHEIDEIRDELMPVNKIYDFNKMIELCQAFYRTTNEKVGVGILMFDRFKASNGKIYSLTESRLEQILSRLDNESFRIDLCTVNDTIAGRQSHQLSNKAAIRLLEVARKRGFECKVFSSFGDTQHSGCGMLSSNQEDIAEAGNTTIIHFNHAIELLNDAKKMAFDAMLNQR